ncbi:MAG: T9SS type A sorting domain-containing protein, partial [Flavobacteriales bacterium]
MKHFTFLFVALLGLTMFAQAQRITDVYTFAQVPMELTDAEAQAMRGSGESALEVAQRGGGTILFYEDFANGFEGNNGIGAWTAEDTGEGMIWQAVDEAGNGYYADGTASGVQPPAGEFSTNIASMNSTTADNGWMVFDCDYFNTPISEGYENTEGWITSPTLDFSAVGSVVITWEQYFRYCCYPYAPIYLQVSNDGGATWTTFDAHGSFIESANTASANVLTTSVDISCAAAYSAEVQVRFSYLQAPETGDAYSHYYWGIDDVTISENPVANDLAVVQVTNGDVYNVFEYRVTPLEQAIPEADGGLLAGVLYRNNGNADQDETTVTVKIYDEGGTELSSTTTELGTVNSFANAVNCPANSQDTVYVATGWTPTATGNYVLEATIASANEDESSDDNTLSKVIVYTDDEYGHDDESTLDVEFTPRDSDIEGLFNPCGYGNYFHMHNAGSMAYGVTVRFGPSCGGGDLEFETRLYTYDGAVGLTDSPFETTYWTYDDAWTPSGVDNSDFVYLPFEDPIELTNENFYFVGVINEFESEAQLTVLGNADSDTDNSTGDYNLTGAGDYVWFTSQTATPAIRLILSERVGIDEIANRNGIELHQNVPNPANGTTMIRFELLQARNVTVEMRDLQGRLIQAVERGQLPAGTHQVDLNIADLQGGIYTYTLVADGMRLTKKMMV